MNSTFIEFTNIIVAILKKLSTGQNRQQIVGMMSISVKEDLK